MLRILVALLATISTTYGFGLCGAALAMVPISHNYSFLNTQTALSEQIATSEPEQDTPREDKSWDDSSLYYQYSAEQSERTVSTLLNKVRKTDSGNAEKLNQLFSSRDVFAEIRKSMTGKGLAYDNIGSAFAVYWIAAWQAALGQTKDIDGETYRTVASQSAAAFLESGDLSVLTNNQKQEFAETLLVQALTLEIANAQAQGDEQKLLKLRDQVVRDLKKEGLDLDAMTLTEQGFVPAKKGSDAGAAVDAANPVAADKALASAEGAGADSGGLSPLHYALIAAGAGLGGVFLLGKAAGRRS